MMRLPAPVLVFGLAMAVLIGGPASARAAEPADVFSAMVARPGADLQNNLTLAGRPSRAQINRLARYAGWFRISTSNNPPADELNDNALAVARRAIATKRPVLLTVESQPFSTSHSDLDKTLGNAAQLAAWAKKNCSPSQCAIQCTNETGFPPSEMWGQTSGLQIAKRCISNIRVAGWTGYVMLNVQLKTQGGDYYSDGANALKDVDPLPVDTDGTRGKLVITWHWYTDYQKQGTQDKSGAGKPIPARSIPLPDNYRAVIDGAFSTAKNSPPGRAGMKLGTDEVGWPGDAPDQTGEVVRWGKAFADAARKKNQFVSFFAVNGGGPYHLDDEDIDLSPAAEAVFERKKR